jgi:hypothetical protein
MNLVERKIEALRSMVTVVGHVMTVKARQLADNHESDGNQQKVVLSKWLATKPRVMLLDEPTRGIDIGAKAEVHRLIAELAAAGMAVLMISSDLPEVLAMSDRISNETRFGSDMFSVTALGIGWTTRVKPRNGKASSSPDWESRAGRRSPKLPNVALARFRFNDHPDGLGIAAGKELRRLVRLGFVHDTRAGS